MISIEDKILTRIKQKGRGYVFVNKDFANLANIATIDWSLYKLKEKKLFAPYYEVFMIFPNIASC
jgi:hypothetical protein